MAKDRTLSLMIVIPSLLGGGAERVAVDLATYWQRKGYEVTLLTQSDSGTDVYHLPSTICRICTHQLGQTGIVAQIKKVWAIRRAIKQYRPDIVIGMMTSSSVMSILASIGLSVNVIATEHAHPPSQQLSFFWQKLRQMTYPRAAKVLALTKMSADWIHQHILHTSVAVIPNAVRFPLHNQPPYIPVQKPDQTKLLLAVGRLHTEKGFDVLLNAFAQIADANNQWRLVILGEGGQRQALEDQIQQLGLENKVSLPGRVGNLKDWYEQADMFVLSSRYEGLSNSLQEAMASGLCVVSFDCDTGPREVIREGIDGVLVRPVSDSKALAESLNQLMRDENLRHYYASNAPEVIHRFSAQEISEKWDDLFSTLLGCQ
ncbi:glycosyltransferase family 4 protein [Pelistega ratti]|uniref:glycosyltransferase family 4 protein n=1 Tax=Pelistega ratti TaxID=2652177 RepID=UPI001FAAFBDF|nr:glycosyltransferase family 4 protein [Pelistega ratti]